MVMCRGSLPQPCPRPSSPRRRRRVLTGPQQLGLAQWEPAAPPPQLQQQVDAAAAAVAAAETGQSEAAETYELLQQLPGLQRSLRRAAQEGAGLPDLEAMKMCPEDVMRLPRKPEPVLNEWDLRARMEKRRRQERETAGALRPGGGALGEAPLLTGWLACLLRLAASLPALQLTALVSHAAAPDAACCPAMPSPLPFPTRPSLPHPPPAEWNAERAAVGRYPSHGSDWRTDTRIKDTGDPTAPLYREWTHTEIWDLITLNGRNADPRDVAVWVLNPKAVAGERCWLLLLQGWRWPAVTACWAAAGCELAAAEAAWSRGAAVRLCRRQTSAAGAGITCGMPPCPALRLLHATCNCTAAALLPHQLPAVHAGPALRSRASPPC